MTFPIIGGNSAVAGYSIDNSLRVNPSDNPTLIKSIGSGGNQNEWTLSFWIKIGATTTSANVNTILTADTGGTTAIQYEGNTFRFAWSGANLQPNALIRDQSAWYHYVISADVTNATASNRIKIYINGIDQDDNGYSIDGRSGLSSNDLKIFGNYQHTFFTNPAATTRDYDGYIAEVHAVEGQTLSPTDFGEFDSNSGIWKPKQYTGSYGTNGFYLDFENSGSLGTDQSGNGNNFTPNNLASTDQTTDTPTNNFATLNSVEKIDTTPSEGNCQFNGNAVTLDSMRGTIGISTGKWYWEVKVIAIGVGGNIGIATNDSALSAGGTLTGVLQQYSGFKSIDGWSNNGSYGGFTTGDIIGVALDMDGGEIEFYKNGSSQGVAYSSLDTTKTFFPFVQGSTSLQYGVNFGNPSFSISSGNTDGNGYGNFEYSVPSGYLALCTQNLATALSPTIDDGSAYFQTALWTGTGSSLEITNDGNSDLQPDFFWGKSRSNGSGHTLIDSSRGLTKYLVSNDTAGDATDSTTITSFNTDGFTLGTDSSTTINYSGRTYVGWQWKANGGTTSSNTDGSITATLQSNATSGFAIATWSGTGTAGTIGHGLGVAPKLVIVKRRNTPANSWAVQHSDLASDFVTFLNRSDTGGETDSTMFNGTHPTSSVFSVGTHAGTNQSGGTYVGYIFAPITGYSAMGTYTGNGSTDGTFIYTGFRPAWIMVKRLTSGAGWSILDAKRNEFNPVDKLLQANVSNQEFTPYDVDFVSNGFKWRTTDSTHNQSGSSFIYMAFAENPFVDSNGIPVTAR